MAFPLDEEGPELIAPQMSDDMREEIRNAIGNIISKSKMEPHCSIPDDTREKFIELQKEKHLIKSKYRAVEAKLELFWTDLEERLKIYDRSISLDIEKNLILVEKEHGSSNAK